MAASFISVSENNEGNNFFRGTFAFVNHDFLRNRCVLFQDNHDGTIKAIAIIDSSSIEFDKLRNKILKKHDYVEGTKISTEII